MNGERPDLDLPDLAASASRARDMEMTQVAGQMQPSDTDEASKTSADLAPVFDVPVHIQAVVGKTSIDVASLLRLTSGSVLELDRKVGEAIDIYVNSRLVARGEVVVVDDRLGVTMTEIIKDGDAA